MTTSSEVPSIRMVGIIAMIGFLLGIQSNLYVTSFQYLTSRADYDYLHDLYVSANGQYWNWSKPYSRHGYPWNFSNYETQNPCRRYWQGVFCSPIGCTYTADSSICSIFTIEVDNLNLSGTLPPVVSNLTYLYFYDVSSNDLYGHLPIFNNTPNLEYVNFSYNHLTGTIPPNFLETDNVPYLYLIYLSNNHLQGTIPPVFYQLSGGLQYLNLFNNSLTGTISPEIGNLNKSIYINFGANYLNGTIPDSINQLTLMKQLFLCNNQLTGTIPLTLTGLHVLWIDHNHLSGTIPSFLCDASNITVIAVDNNHLGGTVPSCISRLQYLNVLQVQDNNLNGKLLEVFNATMQSNLGVIDFSSNSFSGSFPIEVFRMPNLTSLAAVKNCFTGSLPESLCDTIGQKIQVLSLDGLHSADSCIHYYWNPFQPSESGYYAELMKGSIPTCFWTLPELTTLHLSGNGLTGTLPSLNISSMPIALADVFLTHNQLTGTIPYNIQEYPFESLDLSFNKFTGVMNNFTMIPLLLNPTASLNLENNRLSGNTPHLLAEAENIQILLGNIFQCTNHLPRHDPNALNYICGSTELNTASLAFTCYLGLIFIVFLIMIGYTYHYARSLFERYLAKPMVTIAFVRQYLSILEQTIIQSYLQPDSLQEEQILFIRYKNIYQFLYSLSLIRKITIYTTIYILFLLLPLYFFFYTIDATSNDNEVNPYSKYVIRYTWTTTSAFLTGVIPAAVLLSLWFLLCLLVLYWIFKHFYLHEQEIPPLSRLVSSVKHSFSDFFSNSGSSIDRSHSNLRTSILLTLTGNNNNSTADVSDSMTSHKTQTSLQPVYTNDNSYYTRRKRTNTETSRVSFQVSEDRHPQDNPHYLRSSFAESTTHEKPLVSFSTLSPLATLSPPSVSPEINAPDELPSPLPPRDTTNPRKSWTLRPRSTRMSEADHPPANPSMIERESVARTSFLALRDSIAYFRIENMKDLLRNEEFRNRFNYYSLYLLVLCINGSVSLTVNTYYLVIENSDSISSSTKVVIQVLMAMFKLSWNMILIRRMVTWLQPYEKSVTRLHVGMLVFNSILAPCFATAFTDSSCFKEVFSNTESITSSYTLTSCIESYQEQFGQVISTVCTHYDTVVYSTVFNPTFIYYYTCGTKLLTLYIPVFIYTYTILFVASAVGYGLLAFVDAHYLPAFLLHRLDAVLRPQDRGQILFYKMIRSHSIEALLTQHIVVLLTYGINSPLLAVIMMIAVSFETLLWQVIITRFIKYECKSTPLSPHYYQYLLETWSYRDHLSVSRLSSSAVMAATPQRKEEEAMITSQNPLQQQSTHTTISRPISIRKGKEESMEEEIYGRTSITNNKNYNNNHNSNSNSSSSRNSPILTRMNSIEMTTSRTNSSILSRSQGDSASFRTSEVPNNNPLPEIKETTENEEDLYKNSIAKESKERDLEAAVPPPSSTTAAVTPSLPVSSASASSSPFLPSIRAQIDRIQKIPPLCMLLSDLTERLDSRGSLLGMLEGEIGQHSYSLQQVLDHNQPEQQRLQELNLMIDDAWLCMYNARWLIFYCAIAFNTIILFDFAGDETGWKYALWVPCLLAFLTFLTRLGYTDMIVYMHDWYDSYWLETSKREEKGKEEEEEEEEKKEEEEGTLTRSNHVKKREEEVVEEDFYYDQ